MPLRGQLLNRLMTVLAPQVSSHLDIELLVKTSDPTMPVGENRTAMMKQAVGDYVCFIDDDDLVNPNYVSTIYPLLDGVDYVGFNVEQRINGSLRCIEKRSLTFTKGVYQDGQGGYFRDIAHTNPIRRELALRVPMTGFPEEDTRWANGLRDLGIVKTEHRIDKVLYYYLFRTDKPEEEGKPAIPSIEEYPWLMKTTKVKICVSIAGADVGYAPGQITDLESGLAEAWIGSGLAVRVDEPEEEVAVMPKVETATLPAVAFKGRKH